MFFFLCEVMTDEQKARLSTKRPLTKEEYEARQSVIRKVVDPETGRTRWAECFRSTSQAWICLLLQIYFWKVLFFKKSE